MIDIEKLTRSLPGTADKRGNLYWIEGGLTVPFEIGRVFYMAHVPGLAVRGGHAHRTCHQFIVPLAGQLDALLDDGMGPVQTVLDHMGTGLHVPPMTWCELRNFWQETVCLVLASERYDESDYIRDFKQFLEEVGR